MIRAAVVTGASSGIGLVTVLRVAEAGFEAVGIVADEPGAVQLRAEAARRSLDVAVLVVDLADSGARSGLVTVMRPWALVNNAATGT